MANIKLITITELQELKKIHDEAFKKKWSKKIVNKMLKTLATNAKITI